MQDYLLYTCVKLWESCKMLTVLLINILVVGKVDAFLYMWFLGFSCDNNLSSILEYTIKSKETRSKK